MAFKDRIGSGFTERQWKLICIITSGSILLIAMYFLVEGITTVFSHLFYFPIILIAYHYQKKGVVYSTFLSLFYLLMVIVSDYSNSIEIISALFRTIAFIGVAVVVAYLSSGLHQKQQQYRSISEFNEYIVSNANVWLAVLDDSGTIIVWNKAAEEISGYRAEEVVGKNTIWKMLYPERDYRRTLTQTILRIIGERKFFQNFDTIIRTKKGEKKTISWNTREFPDETGTLPRYIAIGIDVTERALAVEQIKAEQQLAVSVAGGHSLDEILSLGLGIAINLSDMDSGGIYLVDPETRDLELVYSTGLSEEFVRQTGMISADSDKGRIVFSGTTVYSTYRNLDIESGEAEGREGLKAIAVIPIISKNHVIACMNIASHTLDTFPEKKRVVVETIAPYLGNFITWIRAEEALRESEKKYHTLFEGAGDCIYLFEAEGEDRGRIIDANKATLEMHGYSLEELKTMKITDLDVEESRAGAPERFEKALKGGWISGEVMHRRKDGSVFPLEINGGLLDLGTKKYIYAIDRDITERKRAEKVLAESEERFRGVAERSSDIIVLTDMTWNATYVSPSVTKILEYSPEEVVGRSPAVFIMPEDMNKVIDLMGTINQGSSGEAEIRIRKKNGDYAVIEMVGSPIIKDGKISGSQLIGRDITERMQNEQERKEAISQIAHNMEQLAVLNDQIRNPLSAILGYASLEEGPVFEKIIRLCYDIDHIITRLDMGYLESEKVRDFLKKHYNISADEKE
jgi:PAS domain S-box-containing protein